MDAGVVTSLRQSSRARWIVPVAVVALLAAVAVGRGTLAGAAPSLPKLSAAQLLAKVAQARVDTLSGTVRTSTDLGLPSFPDAGGDLSPQALLNGSHTLRVYLDGADRQRVDLLGTLAGSSVVHNGREVWSWSSATNVATHAALPGHPAGKDPARKHPAGKHPAGITPQAVAEQLLAAVGPTTTVTVADNASVAGRSAYDLRLAPKTTDSMVKQADLYVDSATGLPLRVTVLARGADHPAIDVGFSSISFAKPAAKVFTFKAPKGAKVREGSLPQLLAPAGRHHGEDDLDRDMMRPGKMPFPRGSAGSSADAPRVLGTGWARVVEIRGVPTGLLADRRLQSLMKATRTVHGTFGTGHLLSTALLTALITDDGKVFIGAVTPDALVRIANTAR